MNIGKRGEKNGGMGVPPQLPGFRKGIHVGTRVYGKKLG